MTDFPKLTYETLTVGEEFVSDSHLVTPEDIEAYAFAVDDHQDLFTDPSAAGGQVAHPTLMANQALHLRHSKYIVHAGLHARMEFNFIEPVRPGMRVRSRGRVYMVTEYVTEDERGTALVRGQFTQMLIPEGTRHAGR